MTSKVFLGEISEILHFLVGSKIRPLTTIVSVCIKFDSKTSGNTVESRSPPYSLHPSSNASSANIFSAAFLNI